MLRRSRVLAVAFSLAALAACAKKKEEAPSSSGSGSGSATTTATPPPATPDAPAAGSDMGSAGSGSDMTGSAMAGSGSAMAGSGSAADAGSAAGSAAAVDFDKLSHDDQIKFMKTQVVPPMKAAFQKFDAKAFANFGCKTCHGKDPQKAKYKMPSPDIPALDFEALKRGEDKEIAEFMEHTVKPEMAKILGKHEMTQAEPKGFGCLACHTQKKKS